MVDHQFFTDFAVGDVITADKLNTMKNSVAALDGGNTFTGTQNFANDVKFTGTPSSNNAILDFGQSYILYSDNTGAGADKTRLWVSAPTDGEIVFGGRSGSAKLHQFRIRAKNVVIDDDSYSGSTGWTVWHNGNTSNIPKLDSSNSFSQSLYVDGGSNARTIGLRRTGQSGPDAEDKFYLDIVTGTGAARLSNLTGESIVSSLELRKDGSLYLGSNEVWHKGNLKLNVSGVSNGDILVYNSANQTWTATAAEFPTLTGPVHFSGTVSFSSNIGITGQTNWTSSNDGSGSGLDADLLDGKHASQFANSSHAHPGSDILANSPIPASSVPSLDASKITTGSFASARIPNLDASKITSGTFAVAQIPNLSASKITSGTFNTSQIPDLSATKITSGTLSDSRLSTNVVRINKSNTYSSSYTQTINGTLEVSGTLTIPIK